MAGPLLSLLTGTGGDSLQHFSSGQLSPNTIGPSLTFCSIGMLKDLDDRTAPRPHPSLLRASWFSLRSLIFQGPNLWGPGVLRPTVQFGERGVDCGWEKAWDEGGRAGEWHTKGSHNQVSATRLFCITTWIYESMAWNEESVGSWSLKQVWRWTCSANKWLILKIVEITYSMHFIIYQILGLFFIKWRGCQFTVTVGGTLVRVL